MPPNVPVVGTALERETAGSPAGSTVAGCVFSVGDGSTRYSNANSFPCSASPFVSTLSGQFVQTMVQVSVIVMVSVRRMILPMLPAYSDGSEHASAFSAKILQNNA